MISVLSRTIGFEAAGGALVRAVAASDLKLPPWPALTMTGGGPGAVAGWMEWLRQAWGIEAVHDAISQASPALAERIQVLRVAEVPGEREARRVMVSVVRYMVRLTGRPTPNGLFAGVAAASFSSCPSVRWGQAHQVVAGADAGWLAAVIGQLESQPAVVERMRVAANTTLLVRGDRLVVPYQPNTSTRGTGAVEVALRFTGPVRAAVDAAREPMRLGDLRTKVFAEFPRACASDIDGLLATLVKHRVLITSVHAPSTEPDALGHLVRELGEVGEPAAEQHAALEEIHAQLQRHHHAPADTRRTVRAEAADRMRRLAPSRRHPVTVDVRLDADIVLPEAVAREAERAALLLAQLTPHPGGTATWADYHRRFYQRFGCGAQVPLLEVVADSGIGWPDGYPGASRSAPRPQRTPRDERLLALAQIAALDGRHEMILDEALIAELSHRAERPMHLPAHLELCARVDSPTLSALKDGTFRLAVTSVSRSAGVLTGRFLHLLDEHDRQMVTAPLLSSPGDDAVLSAQLSFPPLDPATAHVTRTVRVLPTVISLAEHQETAPAAVLTASDLAVSCDSDRLDLTAPGRGVTVQAWGMHALNLRTHTPPLARFLIELTGAHCAQVPDFDWGAATTLPFLPRLRSGRVVLSAARWRLAATELPGRAADWTAWDAALADWRTRRRLPQRVLLVDGDWRLPLDLDHDAHRVLLREHLAGNPHAVLEEAPASDAAGWCEGRAHEIVVPLAAHQPRATARLPRPTPRRIVRPSEHGLSPGASRLLFAKLYGDPQRQDTVLAEHLPALLAEWGKEQPRWWFLRFASDGEHYLRLRIALPNADPAMFGEAAGRVSSWTNRLRRQGLLREVAFAMSFPETGRWGSGAALTAAETVFTADSRAVLAQLAQAPRPHPHVLAAANFAAMAVAFTGQVEAGMRWLIEHVPAKPPTTVPRPVFADAQRLADPRQDFHALRSAPGGDVIVAAWAERTRTLTTYRSRFGGVDTDGVDPDAALGSLLHTHFLRACGIDADDKATCLYLARVAAMAFTARAGGRR